MPIALFILRRLLLAIPTLLIVTFLGFFLMRYPLELGPWELANPFQPSQKIQLLDHLVFVHPDPLGPYKADPKFTPEAIKKKEQELGLDKPFHEQYLRWFLQLLQGKLGYSTQGEEVGWLILGKAKNTLALNVCAFLCTWLVAIPLGVLAAVYKRSSLDKTLQWISTVGMAFPSMVLALILGMLAVQTGWLPFGETTSAYFDKLSPWEQGLNYLWHLVLPVIVISVGGIAALQRQMRGNLMDVLAQDYLRTARAKGLKESVVIYRHAVRNAINPLITELGFEFSGLLSGSVLIETIVGFQGLGFLVYQAAIQGDTNLVMASLLLSTLMLIMGNLLADILLKLLDPRVEAAC